MIRSHTLVLAGRVLKLKYPEWLGIMVGLSAIFCVS